MNFKNLNYCPSLVLFCCFNPSQMNKDNLNAQTLQIPVILVKLNSNLFFYNFLPLYFVFVKDKDEEKQTQNKKKNTFPRKASSVKKGTGRTERE